MIIKPKPLCAGDRVAVIAPASSTDLSAVKTAEQRISAMGIQPVMFPTCFTHYGHLSATDVERANDVNNAFSDESIDGIICLRGGYGTPRILNMLNYDMIKKNPKVFLGFSDITSLHLAFNKICRMVTYHGPMAASSFAKVKNNQVDFEQYTFDSMKSNLFSDEPVAIYKNPKNEELGALVGGEAEGELIGGNLTLLAATLGSPYELDSKGKIIFIEEIDEPVYKIDRMLTSLALAGKFDDCEGIILGGWINCEREKKSYENGYDLPLDEVFENTLSKFKKPIITNFRAGHIFPQSTMAFGTRIKMDADKKEIIFTESGNEKR